MADQSPVAAKSKDGSEDRFRRIVEQEIQAMLAVIARAKAQETAARRTLAEAQTKLSGLRAVAEAYDQQVLPAPEETIAPAGKEVGAFPALPPASVPPSAPPPVSATPARAGEGMRPSPEHRSPFPSPPVAALPTRTEAPPASDDDLVLAGFDTVAAWAAIRGVQFCTWEDLPAVNRKRDALDLPRFARKMGRAA